MLSEDITSPVLPQKVINTDGKTKATAAYTGRAGVKEMLGDCDGATADYTLPSIPIPNLPTKVTTDWSAHIT